MKKVLFLLTVFFIITFTELIAQPNVVDRYTEMPNIKTTIEHRFQDSNTQVTDWDLNNVTREDLNTKSYKYTSNKNDSKLLVDSIVFYRYTNLENTDSIRVRKVLYDYGSNNNEISLVSYVWDESISIWNNSFKNISEYDSQNNLLLDHSLYWDKSTLLWINNMKNTYEYDDYNNIISEVFYDSYFNSEWLEKYKTDRTFDSNKNTLSEFQYIWDSTNKEYKLYQTYEYDYDINNNKTQDIKIQYFSEDEPDLLERTKVNYDYDINNNLIFVTNMYWDKTNQRWDNHYKTVFEYDSNNNQIFRLSQLCDKYFDIWVDSKKTINNYNLNRKITLDESYSWNKYKNKWIGYGVKREYSYDGDNLILEIRYEWDKSSDNWVGERKYEFLFSSNLRTSFLCYKWKSNEWTINSKAKFTYDNNRNSLLRVYHNWDEASSLWVGTHKYEGDYDAESRLILRSNYRWDSNINGWVGDYDDGKTELFYNKIGDLYFVKSYIWNFDQNNWELNTIGYYNYKEDNVLNINQLTSDVNIYPNPTTNFINLPSKQKYSIYNILGSKVMQGFEKQVDVSCLKVGTYIIKSDIGIGKFVKR